MDEGALLAEFCRNSDGVAAYCDWLIELGPGGGNEGGEIITQGSPLDLKQNSHSQTGPFLEIASP